MSWVFIILVLAGLVSLPVNFVRLFWKSKRKSALRGLAIGFGVTMVATVAFGIVDQREREASAIAQGFVDDSDRKASSQAGFESADLWKANLASVEAAKAATVAAEKARLDAEAAAERKRVEEASAAEAKAKSEREAREAKEAEAAEAVCRKDIKCWGDKFWIDASVQCDGQIERLAKYDFKWVDGWTDVKFSHLRWKDADLGVVTYIGDKIKFQNGFGAWQNAIYECDFDTAAKAALSVRAEPGRL